MATRAKKKKKKKKKNGVDCHASINSLLKRHVLLNGGMDFKIILQECSLSDLLPKLLKWFRLMNKMTARAKNIYKKRKF